MRKNKVVKTRNAGTMTESAFWGMIKSALRQKSRWWKPIMEAKNNARRPYKGSNKLQKWEYKCSVCRKWVKGSELEIHHTTPVGTLGCGDDLKGVVERLFSESGYMAICKPCHKKEHKKNPAGKKNVVSLEKRQHDKRKTNKRNNQASGKLQSNNGPE